MIKNEWFNVVPSVENKDVYYIEFSDGLRLIIREENYDGWYIYN